MSRSFWVAALFAAAACAEPAPAFTEARAAAVRDSATAFLAEFRRLSTAAQWDSVGRLYSDRPDFRFLESGQIQYTSAAAIRGAFSGVPAGQRIETDYDDVTVLALAPGVAVVTGRFTTRFADSTRTLFSYGGALSLVLHHETAGWRIVSGHTSSPVPRGR